MVGLRYPVTRNGEPVLVEIEGLLRMFDDDADPPVATRAWALKGVGSRAYSAGVRGLEQVGDEMHVLTGPIGTARKDSAVVKDYPGTQQVACMHWRFPLAALDATTEIEPELYREFEQPAHVEGVAHTERGWFYVSDFDVKVSLHMESTAR